MKHNEIESLNAEVLANMSVEELEARLEMQVLQMPEACWTCSCDSQCGCCPANTPVSCPSNCPTNTAGGGC
jgi:hypothetical protein